MRFNQTTLLNIALIVIFGLALTQAEAYMGDYQIYILKLIFINAILALSLNLIYGFTGLFSLGPAPLLVKEIFNIIRRINEDGMTVLLVEQNAFAALSVAHYAYILEVGRVVLEGTGQELLENPKVKEAYLGG